MKKLIIIALILMLFPIVNAISIYPAQDIAKDYMQSNEFLDSGLYYVNCDSNEYYMITIVDSKSNLIFFLPIESNNGKVISEDSDDLIKTVHLYRNIKMQTGSNFLAQPLFDKIDNLVISLKSKSARLDGIIKSNYSSSINLKCQNSKEKLEQLITQLQDTKTKLVKLQKEQATFLDTSDCSKTDDLIYSYKNSFTGYNSLIATAMTYSDSAIEIVEPVVADQKLDETTKNIIYSYTAAPTTLSSDIGTITDSISSTSVFYNSIISDFEKTGPTSKVEILKQILKSRQDYYNAKALLYNFDADLKSTLDESINYILGEEQINLWNDSKTVSDLSQNYSQLKEQYNKGRYLESITKIKLAKNQVKKIKEAGTIQLEDQDISNYLIYGIIALIAILGIIIFIKKSKIKKKKTKTNSKEIDPEYLLNKRDPFK
ncbi:MAG: hypothetical protein WCX82_03350 [archaeon]|jgi:hypothetical protein